LVRELGNRTFNSKRIPFLCASRIVSARFVRISKKTNLEGVDVFGHVASVVLFDEERQLAWGIGWANWGVRTNDRLVLGILEIVGIAGSD
jgi:hypothetical protein